jgi:hypothetical protein
MNELKNLKGPKPDPYFAARVLAHHNSQKQSRMLLIWKSIAGFSVVLGCFLSFYFYNQGHATLDYRKALVGKAMILQLDSLPIEDNISYVSLEIDEGMSFQLSNQEASSKKEITLAIESASETKRLPFVFVSNESGKKKVSIKYLDSDFNLVKSEDYFLEFLNKI